MVVAGQGRVFESRFYRFGWHIYLHCTALCGGVSGRYRSPHLDGARLRRNAVVLRGRRDARQDKRKRCAARPERHFCRRESRFVAERAPKQRGGAVLENRPRKREGQISATAVQLHFGATGTGARRFAHGQQLFSHGGEACAQLHDGVQRAYADAHFRNRKSAESHQSARKNGEKSEQQGLFRPNLLRYRKYLSV